MSANRRFGGNSPLSVVVASPTKSGDPVVLGAMGGGVAITNYRSSDGKATVDFTGVFTLSVKGANAAGNTAIAAGDPIYYTSTATPVLNKDATGTFFGYALEAVNSGATTIIMVRLTQGSPPKDYANSQMFVSDEIVGNGSSQSTAHGLGAVPSKVVAFPTDF